MPERNGRNMTTVANAVLLARKAMLERDYDEAYNELYWLAFEWSDDQFQPWQGFELLADDPALQPALDPAPAEQGKDNG